MSLMLSGLHATQEAARVCSCLLSRERLHPRHPQVLTGHNWTGPPSKMTRRARPLSQGGDRHLHGLHGTVPPLSHASTPKPLAKRACDILSSTAASCFRLSLYTRIDPLRTQPVCVIDRWPHAPAPGPPTTPPDSYSRVPLLGSFQPGSCTRISCQLYIMPHRFAPWRSLSLCVHTVCEKL